MIFKINRVKIVAILSILSFLVPISPANALPSTFERELKNAKKTQIGKKTSLAVEQCNWNSRKSSSSPKCTLKKFEVTVNSFTFKEMRNPYDFDHHVYEINVTLKNYSNIETGLDVGALLRCSNSDSSSSFWADGIDPQYVLGKSQLSGVVIAAFPIPAATCQNPTLWLELSSSGIYSQDKAQIRNAKKKKLFRVAYIPLSSSQLNI